MSAQRPPGGDRRPGRPARPGSRRPRDAKPEEARPAKPARVRKDGSVASGTREARIARSEGRTVPAQARPAHTRNDGAPTDGTREARAPRTKDRAAPTQARTERTRKVGSVTTGTREGRTTHGEDRSGSFRAKAVRTQTDDGATGSRREERGARGQRRAAPASAGTARPGKGDAKATRDARSAETDRRAAAASGRSIRPRGKFEDDPNRAEPAPRPDRPRAKPAPRTRADGSVAVRGAERVTREPQRIAKLLARAGIASRREIERMIGDGRIAIDGVALDTPATIVKSLAGITVDGKPVAAPEAARLFLFHKPSGFLTTERDPRGRPTIYDRLPKDMPRVVPVGRLDMNTEGLLLLTTDGGLKRQLELPATGVPRVYRARAYGEISQDQLEGLIEGVEIDGVRYGQIDANLERRTGRNVWIEMTLTEGKNREVRRVLEYLGLQVSRLIRVAYGPFLLGELAAGGVGEVKQHELVEFRKTLR